MKNFILIGAAGYIAPRHLKAISDNRGSLIACNDIADPKQNVSEYFSDVEIFSSFSEFDNFVTNYQLEGNKELLNCAALILCILSILVGH